MRVCQGSQRSTQRGRCGPPGPMSRTAPARRRSLRPVPTNRRHRPRRRRWRLSSTAPAWPRGPMRRSSVRSRRGSRSPGRSDCYGSRGRSSSELSSRSRAQRSSCARSRRTSPSSRPSRRRNPPLPSPGEDRRTRRASARLRFASRSGERAESGPIERSRRGRVGEPAGGNGQSARGGVGRPGGDAGRIG